MASSFGFTDAEGGSAATFRGVPTSDGFMSFPSGSGGQQPQSFAAPSYTMFNPAQVSSSSSQESLSGSVGDGARSHRSNRYVPVGSYEEDFQNDKPLLEELGVDFRHIYIKVMSVLNPLKKIDASIMEESDMAGPIVFCLVLGFCLLLAGKVHFGYIYGFGAFGCVGIHTIVNLMASPSHSLDISRVFSVLGYGLLPIVTLAALAVFIDLRSIFGAALGVACIFFCTYSGTRFFVAAAQMDAQRWLIAYPTFLFYACFALMTIF